MSRPDATDLRQQFAITCAGTDWMWTYSNITAAEAQRIAVTLTRDGETWTAEPVTAEFLARRTADRVAAYVAAKDMTGPPRMPLS